MNQEDNEDEIVFFSFGKENQMLSKLTIGDPSKKNFLLNDPIFENLCPESKYLGNKECDVCGKKLRFWVQAKMTWFLFVTNSASFVEGIIVKCIAIREELIQKRKQNSAKFAQFVIKNIFGVQSMKNTSLRKTRK